METAKKKITFASIYEKYGVFLILVLEIIIFSCITQNFFSVDNLLNVARQVSFTGIAAVGSTMLMVAGGMDVSSGSMLAFSGVICATFLVDFNLPIWLSILLTLIIGFGFGTISGVMYAKFKVSPFISTLAMQTILKGLAYIITNAKPIRINIPEFKFLGQGYVFGLIPFPIVVMIVLFAFGFWVMNKTYMGRRIYAIGGNPEAARLAGVKVNRYNILLFGVSAFFAAVAGVLMAARLGAGQPQIGGDFAMDVITAIVLGGVSITGGSGKIILVVAGVFIMGILSNGMIMLGLNEYWQWVVRGIVLFFAVAMSNLNSRKN